MKKTLLLIAVLFSFLKLQAQQEHHYTQFMHTQLMINPAYAGHHSVAYVMALYRSQWVGFDGAPSSALVSINSPLLRPRVGIGGIMSLQQIGLNRDFFLNLAYSYDLVATDMVKFRLGIMGSMRSFSIDFANAQPNITGDNSIGLEKTNQLLGNVGAGLYSEIAGRVTVGFSVPRIYSNRIGVNTTPNLNTAAEYRHYYGVVGAKIPVSNDINFSPWVQVKYVKNAPLDVDANVSLEIREKVTAGISYRLGGDGPGDSVDLLVFWKAVPMVGIGVAYDFSLSNIKDYTAGSFEILVRADLKRGDPSSTKNLTNPRLF